MVPSDPLSRRTFMFGAAAAAAGTLVSGIRPLHASPNRRIGIGLIGCGSFGNNLLRQCLRQREALNLEIAALCDVWQVNLDRTAGAVAETTGRRPPVFARYRDLLDLEQVDAVIIATPDFAHCPMLRDSARAGKHVFVEKPMATNMSDLLEATDAVVQSGVVCQVGTQRRANGRFRAAAKMIQSGMLGKMVKCEAAIHDRGPRWVRDFSNVRQRDVDWEQFLMGTEPGPFDARRFRLWHLYKDFSNGPVGLLGSHVIDVAAWFNDDPIPRYAVGMEQRIVWTERENPDIQECLYFYPKQWVLHYSTRLGNNHPTPENTFYGTRGTFDTRSWTARGDGGGQQAIDEPVEVEPVASTGHVENWIECIRSGSRQTYADIHAGYAQSVTCIMGARAAETGRRISYDPRMRTLMDG